ncbi:MAG: hypothetical protein AUK53_03310 [Betaproteobacteria bacterium CG2_30_59_46]|nr:MAG: hypothetical protein AUK53_03310 [Betaproteobacteria bacterium CG2_30_59_46]PIQ13731.1 MAG: hypothetical protein COW70_03080 [Hydrogenophilales bacterium CG18_big_fil_WC_8_21_14_2_50_58_12]
MSINQIGGKYFSAIAASSNQDAQMIRQNIGEIGTLIVSTLENTREGTVKAENLTTLAESLDNTVTAFKLN